MAIAYMWTLSDKGDSPDEHTRNLIARSVYIISLLLVPVEIVATRLGYQEASGAFTRVCLIMAKPILVVNGASS